MGLDGMMTRRLPLNRKERYFTGTVFPMIVCRDNFRHLGRFLDLIPGCPKLTIDGRPDIANVQFFTEYSFVESLRGGARDRFPNPPSSPDTPDIVVLIEGEQRVLIAVEAKMYDATTPADLSAQMDVQKVIVDYLRQELNLDLAIQCALVPKPLKDAATKTGDFPYPIVSWEKLHDAFADLVPDDHFLAVLRYALDNYTKLVGVAHERGRNAAAILTGQQIYDGKSADDFDYKVMGRDQGFHGPQLTEDIASGRWRRQKYEVGVIETPPNRNWFMITEFIRRVDEHAIREDARSTDDISVIH